MAKLYPVELVLNIYDYRLWYFLPGYTGYEVSNDGYIRSMKHYKKHPYGVLLSPVSSDKNKQDPLFELSDDDNKRKRLRLSEIMNIARSKHNAVAGYPRPTTMGSNAGRNKFVRNKDGAYVKVYNGPGVRNSIDVPQLDNTITYPKFSIIQDNSLPKVTKVPIKSIKGDEYYGRKDPRAIYDIDVYTRPS
jgi:hypothetical protein